MMREQSPEDLKWMGTYVQDYQRVRDKIQDALQKMKPAVLNYYTPRQTCFRLIQIDFNQQIDLVKSGRPLASLPVLEMPKPIPYPATPKQFYTISHEPKHPIAPIGVHPTGASNAAGGAPSNMAAKNRSYSPGPVNSSMVNGSSPSARTAQQASSTTVAAQPQNISSQTNLGGGGQFKQQMNENQSSMNEISPNQYMQQQQQSSTNAQQQQQKGPPSVQQQQQMSQPVQQSMRNDFTPWSDPLQGLTQSLFGNKPLVNMLDNFGTYPTSGASMPQGLVQQGQQSASLNKNAPSSPAVHVQQVPPPQLMSTIPPPPIVLPPNTATATGQWHPSAAAAAVAAGWTFGGPPPPSQQQQMYTAASRQLHSAPPQSMDQQQQSQNGPVGAQDDSMQSYGRSSRQQTERNSPLSSIDTSMDSQITSDKSKQIDAVVEQLRSVFPHLNSESIRDCVNEFRSMQYNRSLKGLSIEHLFYGVSNVIFARHKSQQNASGWSVPPPFSLGANPDGSSNGPASQYGAGPFEQQQQPLCTLCGCGMRGNDVYTLNCNHTFHNNVLAFSTNVQEKVGRQGQKISVCIRSSELKERKTQRHAHADKNDM
uniref:Uncharacterized protein n=1 Tax=Romanomermis culicivorax TaxID=13658 RepID=A0A915IY58_ROMCU